MTHPTSERVAIFGLGYVGAVTAACLAKLGHKVIGVDRDSFKVERIVAGEAPFYEPELAELLKAGVQQGNLTATTSAEEALGQSEIVLICVGTPSERNGNLDLSHLRTVAKEIEAHLTHRTGSLIVAVRSTVFPGTCEDVFHSLTSQNCKLSVVSNPEFLREGTAIRDFVEPSLVVVGGSDPAAVGRVSGLYASLGVSACEVSLRTAEMIKYACNAFHAVKINFANEIDAVAAALGVDGTEVMRTLCNDRKLNVSAAYLRPGMAFGGSCLPKDLRALTYRARQMDVKVPQLNAALPANDEQLRRAMDRVMDIPASALGIYGLSFKADTDDLRESPVIHLMEFLIGKGRQVRVFDPHVNLKVIYGVNRQYVLSAIPHIGCLLEDDLESLIQRSSHIVLTQPPSQAALEVLLASGRPLIDIASSQLFDIRCQNAHSVVTSA